METLPNQELAQQLFNINWAAVQSDNMHDCERVKELVHQIEARQPPYCIALVSGCPSSQINDKNGKETISINVYLLKR